MRVWRICKTRYRDAAFDGEGAPRHGGRWNRPGTRVVYTADSAALAALEVIVHVETASLFGSYVLLPARLPDDHVESLPPEDLPADWRQHPPADSTQALGDTWSREARSLALAVPSTIVPGRILLLNPAHPGFDEVEVEDAVDWEVDPRLRGDG